ncbi:MAG: hypothetical protein UR63_C0041G0004 [Candidatus Roizmanbacteria bacterium GW2011_GWC2_35_12]|uniref:IrrE N-terminal-like domain-containing protein n=2 Tax=Candidatus Roizmaniibacteriota TaxID=1752723 RepID=A0A0F9ZDL7_9BACT|nr:MAG: hypothetical protein UR23_C0011G0004 [Candidatus Roizmanbacteria bacterium GW2011_GWA2_32_13]KKP65956.1 MAG: hypothetical protein UR63_C0041G0004 [Candidatus Roizmanbacteria bacterium GW2011_GWC2_35_12]
MEIKIKIIKTESDYKEALELVEMFMDKNPKPESEEGEKLNLLTKLIEDYESSKFPIELPDPIDAILFRMEQQNLKPRDLMPYIGSRSKVSEVLSRKRPLTINMMRALEVGLGIPAKVLLKESDEFRNAENITWNRFPLKEMEKRGYFENISLTTTNIEKLVKDFFNPVGLPLQFVGMLRKSYYVRSVRPMNKYALTAWSVYISKKANEIKYPRKFKPGTVNLAFMQKIVQLSKETNGPALVGGFLKDCGIGFVVEPHFPQTYLDGAAILKNKQHPVIGLTLRYDRLDNFWFTLMHELAHISLHYNQVTNLFYDDLDRLDDNNIQEQDADKLAGESLIPEKIWENSPARLVPSPIAAQSLAQEIGIHPAIVAGKMRHENNRYHYLISLLGQGEVRKHFLKVKWIK